MPYDWDKRFEALSQAEARLTDKQLRKLIASYQRARHDLKSEITAQVAQFAVDNNLSAPDARKTLNSGELEEFRWAVRDYIRYAQENDLSPDWGRKLKNASCRHKITKMQAADIHIQQQAEELFKKIDSAHDDISQKSYNHAYHHTAYETMRGVGVGWEFTGPDPDRVRKAAASGWAKDGIRYTDRIWAAKEALLNSIHDELVTAAIRGESIDRTVSRCMQLMDREIPRWKVERLIRTESAFIATAAQLDSYRALGCDGAKFLATLDEKTCESCGPLDGVVFPLDESIAGRTVPPVHPNCRCTLMPWWSDSDTEFPSAHRAARDPDTGKTVNVPDMTYEEWKSAFMDGKAELWGKVENARGLVEESMGQDLGKEVNQSLARSEFSREREDAVKVFKIVNDSKSAVRILSGDNHTIINRVNRGGQNKSEKDMSLMVKEKDTAELTVKEVIKAIDDAMSASTLYHDVVLYRALGSKHALKGADPTNKKALDALIGQIYADESYMSSSLFMDSTWLFQHKGGAIFRLHLKAGTGKGIYINEASVNINDEYEYLIAKGKKFRYGSYEIKKGTIDDNGDLIIFDMWEV